MYKELTYNIFQVFLFTYLSLDVSYFIVEKQSIHFFKNSSEITANHDTDN